MVSVTRAPWTTREKMSRPRPSVPNRCAADGAQQAVPQHLLVRTVRREERRQRGHQEQAQDDRGPQDHQPVPAPEDEGVAQVAPTRLGAPPAGLGPLSRVRRAGCRRHGSV